MAEHAARWGCHRAARLALHMWLAAALAVPGAPGPHAAAVVAQGGGHARAVLCPGPARRRLLLRERGGADADGDDEGGSSVDGVASSVPVPDPYVLCGPQQRAPPAPDWPC